MDNHRLRDSVGSASPSIFTAWQLGIGVISFLLLYRRKGETGKNGNKGVGRWCLNVGAIFFVLLLLCYLYPIWFGYIYSGFLIFLKKSIVMERYVSCFVGFVIMVYCLRVWCGLDAGLASSCAVWS